ncbi:MAG: diguanylate cyclase [Burkholderiaceae bacterium]
MTLALVSIGTTLIIMAELTLGILSSGIRQEQTSRQVISQALAVQLASIVQVADQDEMEAVVESVAHTSDAIRSIGLRKRDASLLVQSAEHYRSWSEPLDNHLAQNQAIVRLDTESGRWGQVEVLFEEDSAPLGVKLLKDPLVRTLLFMVLAGVPVYWLYLRRALQHLDPASVIPERVQTAFDTMSEGIVIIDADGRVLLVSHAFQKMNPTETPVRSGVVLSSVDWLAIGLGSDISQHPWIRAMNENQSISGESMTVATSFGHQHLVVGCAPIGEPERPARGCMVTFSDVTELYRSNEALRDANHALSDSQAEIQRQNVELQRLATRDPLTGCLNRRALLDAFDELVMQAKAEGLGISCLIIDIDHFKRVNDTHGHGIGDRVIQEVAKRLLESTRSTDLVCRYGGEEFCIVLPGMDAEGAVVLADRILQRIAERAGRSVREIEGLHVTVSVGASFAKGMQVEAKRLIDEADVALYEAKDAGRNQTQAHWMLDKERETDHG